MISNQYVPAISAANKNTVIRISGAASNDVRSVQYSYMDTAAPPLYSKYTDAFQGRLIIVAGNVDENVAASLTVGSAQTVESVLGHRVLLDLDLNDPTGCVDFPHANQGTAGAIQGEPIAIILVAPQAWNAGVKRASVFVGKLNVQAAERFGR